MLYPQGNLQKNKKTDYSYLVEEFTEERIKERMAFLIESAKLIIKSHEVEEYIIINIYSNIVN